MNETYQLPDLANNYGALEPHISGKIMELHHGRHHAGYVKGANQALERLGAARAGEEVTTLTMLQRDLAFHMVGHVLHSLFWTNAKGDFLDAVWQVLNWPDVAERLAAARRLHA